MTTSTRSSVSVAATLAQMGRVFATFDGRTQDSGHVSYGVVTTVGRRFVKTAGRRDTSTTLDARHQGRVEALRRAAALQQEVSHEAMVRLETLITATDGVLVVYDWFDGQLLRSPTTGRAHPAPAFRRFCRLPVAERVAALDQVIDLHVALARAGWLVGDLYDGSLMYDFAAHRIKVIDLECCHRGPYVNDIGRLPGSTRFMAPEEHRLGAVIDARTTVFNLGRMLAVFLAGDHPDPGLLAVIGSATARQPAARPASLADLQRDWRAAVGRLG